MKKGAKDGVEEDVKGFLKKDSALGKMSTEEKREETENRGNGDGSQG